MQIEPMNMRSFLKALPGLISFVLIVGGIFAVFHYFDEATIKTYIQSAGLWAPALLIMAKASTIVVAPLGGGPLYPLAGALFGFWEGFLYIMLGDILGACISFWLSRLFGNRIVEYFFSDSTLIRKVIATLGTFKGFLVARIGFIALPEVISYAAGLSRINFLTFFALFAFFDIFPAATLVALGTFITDKSGSLIYTGVLVAGALVCAAGIALFAKYVASQNPVIEEELRKEGTMGL